MYSPAPHALSATPAGSRVTELADTMAALVKAERTYRRRGEDERAESCWSPVSGWDGARTSSLEAACAPRSASSPPASSMTCATAGTRRYASTPSRSTRSSSPSSSSPPRSIEAAVAMVSPEFLEAIAVAAAAIEDFHKRQVQQSWFTTQPGGIFLGQKVTAISPRGHLTCPVGAPSIRAVRGRTRFPRSSPASRRSRWSCRRSARLREPVHACGGPEAGVDALHRIGGAQAIAALAYGTDQIPRVDKVVGFRNAYVTAAKKLVMGDVGIDMLAGPSEVLILADDTFVPAFVAIDLMAHPPTLRARPPTWSPPTGSCRTSSTRRPHISDRRVAARRDHRALADPHNGVANDRADVADGARHLPTSSRRSTSRCRWPTPFDLLGSISCGRDLPRPVDA